MSFCSSCILLSQIFPGYTYHSFCDLAMSCRCNSLDYLFRFSSRTLFTNSLKLVIDHPIHLSFSGDFLCAVLQCRFAVYDSSQRPYNLLRKTIFLMSHPGASSITICSTGLQLVVVLRPPPPQPVLMARSSLVRKTGMHKYCSHQ